MYFDYQSTTPVADHVLKEMRPHFQMPSLIPTPQTMHLAGALPLQLKLQLSA